MQVNNRVGDVLSGVLHVDPLLDGSEIVTQVYSTRRLGSRKYLFRVFVAFLQVIWVNSSSGGHCKLFTEVEQNAIFDLLALLEIKVTSPLLNIFHHTIRILQIELREIIESL